MKTRHRYGFVAVWCVIVFALVPSMCAQQATAPRHIGVPQDWSQNHIVFTRDGLAKHPELIYREPRVLQQAMQRWQVPNFGAFEGAEPHPVFVNKSGVSRDWSEPLAGRLGANMFPAKFSFYVDTEPDCLNDFVVFGLAVPGVTGGAANLVAFNNLYVNDGGTGICPGTAPNVLFAYNITTATGGRISLSPILSLDGKKIGFVESVPGTVDTITATSITANVLTVTASNSNLTVGEQVRIQGTAESFLNGQIVTVASLTGPGPTYTGFTASFTHADYANASDVGTVSPPGQAIFHVLTWTAGEGTLSGAAVPTSMTSLTFSPLYNSTRSSPWIDYGADIVYLGADSGQVFKITSVFNGTPTLPGGIWPVTINAPSYRLTAPVLDSGLHVLMVGSASGNLYQIDTTSGAVLTLAVGATASTTPGIVAAPIVDVTNGTTFVVSANTGSSAALVEVKTTTMKAHSTALIGVGSSTGTALRLYEPAFSHDYFTDPNLTTSFVTLCGTGTGADTSPWQYAFGFTGDTMSETPKFTRQLSTSTTDRCSGWTEFFNPNVGAAPGTDFFFFGLTQDCTTKLGGTSTTGCLVALGTDGVSTTTTTAPVVGGPSGIVIDNYYSDITNPGTSSIYLTSLTQNTAYKFTQNGLQ